MEQLSKIKCLSLLAVSLLMVGATAAQGTGSAEATGGTVGFSVVSMAVSDTTTSVAESLYIGPGNYQVDGTWNIYSKNVWISPEATITGTGTIKFYNPSAAGGTSGPTLIDGNNSAANIDVNIELYNASNLILTDLPGPGAPWADATGQANIIIGKGFSFAVPNGNVVLGNYDMVTATAATLNNYQPDRFVITNGTGHLVHSNYTGAFTYPVGIAQGDYTPASVNNTTANTIHVMVQNYITSVAVESGSDGMNRTWNIYAGNASGNSTIALQHNNGTNQSAFNDGSHFVTRNGTAPNNTGDNASLSSWQSNALGAGTAGNLSSTGTVSGSSLRSRAYTDFATTASATTASYSKSSEPITPLPVTLVSFTGSPDKCVVTLSWKTAHERDMDRFDIEYSNDGATFSVIGQVAGNNNPEGGAYSFVTQQANSKGMYRLSIVDLDGRATKSQVVTVYTQCQEETIDWSVFPTPAGFGQKVVVQVNSDKNLEGIRLVVVNTLGQVLMDSRFSIIAGITQYQLPVAHWAKGTYIVTLIDNKGNPIRKANKLILR